MTSREVHRLARKIEAISFRPSKVDEWQDEELSTLAREIDNHLFYAYQKAKRLTHFTRNLESR